MANSFGKKVKDFFLAENDIDENEDFEGESRSVMEEKDTISYSNKKKVVDFKSSAQMKVVVINPTEYADAEFIVANLKNNKPVIVNLEGVDTNLAQKIFNFCNGAICALDGNIKKISNGIIILAPMNVSLDAIQENNKSSNKQKDYDGLGNVFNR